MKLTSSQRKYLRSLAHHLKPVVYIGKNDLARGVMDSIDKNLFTHELLKVKSHDDKITKENLILIENKLNCSIVGQIGKTAIIFRQNSDIELQKIKLPK